MSVPYRRWLGLLCFCVGVGAHAGQLVKQVFDSQVLQRKYHYTVYLPDVYASGSERYAVLYLLHGAGGDENEWLDNGAVRETLDGLIAQEKIQPMIVVMPGHPQGWWVNGASDLSETALMQELMPHAESEFRMKTAPGNRLVAGVSAGAYGALNLALKYPRRFAAAAMLSPAIYNPLPPMHSSARRQPPFQTAGKFDPLRWQALNYVVHIDAYKLSRIIVPLFILSGDHDNLGIALQAAILYESLRLHQPEAIALRIVNGDHDWILWRDTLPQALLFLNAHIKPPSGQ